MLLHSLFASAFFVTVVHVAATSEICGTHPLHYCTLKEKINNLPITEAEIDQFCITITTYQDCILNYIQVCQSANIPNQEVFESGIINKLCNKDSLFYKEFLANAKCLSENGDHINEFGYCSRHVHALEEKEPEKVDRFEKLYGSETEPTAVLKLRSCLNIAFQMGCYVYNVNERCGYGAKQFIQKIIVESKVMDSQCSPKHLLIAEEATKLLDLEFKEPTLLDILI